MEIFEFAFFWRALIICLLFSVVSWIFGSLIVFRREVQITHTLSNWALLWIVLWFLFWFNIDIFSSLTAIILVIFIYFLIKNRKITPESVLELSAQVSLALAIFLLWFLSFIKVEINSFLFWSILSSNSLDAIIIFIISLFSVWFFSLFYKKILAISINNNLAILSYKNINLIEFLYYIFLAVIISFGIKIFWILLLWAFLVLPPNIAKLVSKNVNNYLFYAIIFWSISSILWIFLSYYLNSPTGPTIILVLFFLFLLAYFFSNKKASN
jgi:zinc transport system permease protein